MAFGETSMRKKPRLIMAPLEQILRELPPDLQQEVEDFARFLYENRRQRTSAKLSLQWRGALRDEKDQYTSVQLQHHIRDQW